MWISIHIFNIGYVPLVIVFYISGWISRYPHNHIYIYIRIDLTIKIKFPAMRQHSAVEHNAAAIVFLSVFSLASPMQFEGLFLKRLRTYFD